MCLIFFSIPQWSDSCQTVLNSCQPRMSAPFSNHTSLSLLKLSRKSKVLRDTPKLYLDQRKAKYGSCEPEGFTLIQGVWASFSRSLFGGTFQKYELFFFLSFLVQKRKEKKAHIIKPKCNTWAAKLAWRVRCHGMKPARKEGLGINIWTGVRKHSWVKKTKTKSGERLCLRLTFKSTFYKDIVANSSILQTVLMLFVGEVEAAFTVEL